MLRYETTDWQKVKNSNLDITDVLWLESHIISIPVAHDYNLNDMEYIAECIQQWQNL